MAASGHATTAVVSAKGGVGKTTTSVNLGAALASRGQTVLVVNLDCQASASLSLGLQRHQLAPSAADVMLRREPAGRAARPTKQAGLWVLPASADLLSVETDHTAPRGRERVLARALEPLRECFDHILIDGPPGLEVRTNARLAEAPAHGSSVLDHDPSCVGSHCHRLLAEDPAAAAAPRPSCGCGRRGTAERPSALSSRSAPARRSRSSHGGRAADRCGEESTVTARRAPLR